MCLNEPAVLSGCNSKHCQSMYYGNKPLCFIVLNIFNQVKKGRPNRERHLLEGLVTGLNILYMESLSLSTIQSLRGQATLLAMTRLERSKVKGRPPVQHLWSSLRSNQIRREQSSWVMRSHVDNSNYVKSQCVIHFTWCVYINCMYSIFLRPFPSWWRRGRPGPEPVNVSIHCQIVNFLFIFLLCGVFMQHKITPVTHASLLPNSGFIITGLNWLQKEREMSGVLKNRGGAVPEGEGVFFSRWDYQIARDDSYNTNLSVIVSNIQMNSCSHRWRQQAHGA